MNVPLVDLMAAHAEIDGEVREGFDELLSTGAFIMGPAVRAFEEEYAAYTETKHCLGVSSGTDALELMMRAAGVGHGDEVVVPVNTFFATATAVSRTGATPVFVDCDPDYLLMDPEGLEAAITPRTRALLPVHLYGQMAPMAEVLDVADRHGLLVFEDAAQCQGARQAGRTSGSFGLAAATSFYPGKNLGAYGDGGAIVTNDDSLAGKLRALRNYGSEVKYEHPAVGFNCRLDSLQAVVLRAKLKHLDDWNALRTQAADRYDTLLDSLSGVEPVRRRPENDHVHHLYVVRLPGDVAERDRVMSELQSRGVGAGLHYPTPLHQTGAYSGLDHPSGGFPVAEAHAGSILSLPLFPQITPEQQIYVTTQLAAALGQ